MIKKYLLIGLLLNLSVICSILAQNVRPDKIESLKMRPPDMPNEFLLNQERLAKPGVSSNEQVYQFWRRGSKEKDMVLIEEAKQKFDNPVGASSFQKWYRGNKTGEKDKIEIDIIICISDSEMENTITYFTKEAFAAQFHNTEIPFAGEKSWMPKYVHPRQDTYSVMFLKFNVFVRMYVRLKDKSVDELHQMTENLAKIIENKIVL